MEPNLKYRASLNLDFTKQKSYQYQKLIAALIDTGWKYVETSALIIEHDDLAPIWQGIELVAKQSSSAGLLSALTFHIQGAQRFGGKAYAAAKNHRKAVTQILAKPSPRKK